MCIQHILGGILLLMAGNFKTLAGKELKLLVMLKFHINRLIT